MAKARVEIHPAPAGAGHARQHVITAPLDHTSSATPGQILQADANGLPVDAANTDAQVALAVGLGHAQGTDTALGAVGVKNPPVDADKPLYRDSTAADALVTSTWAQIKAFLKTYFDTLYAAIGLAHNRLHSITSILDHTSGATPGQILQADPNGLPIDAATTNAQVAAAVALAHARQHAITNALDHTSAATPGKILQADANGLPVDGTNTNADVADAVAKKHTQGTDTALGAVGTKNPPIDADKSLYRDSTAGDALVTSTWTQIKAFLKSYWDTLYEALGSVATHAGLTTGVHGVGAGTVAKVGDIAVDANLSAAAQDAITKRHTQGTDTTLGTLTANVNFAMYKAIAMVCDNGATVPALPVAAQWFLHTPTGRKVLMQYDGSDWINIASIGAMTMYVDKTDGSDSYDKGGAVDSGAFKTIQYAINRIPGVIGGNVVININDEDYNETVTIEGKRPTGSYTITLQGQLSSALETISSATIGVGTGRQQGTITKAGAFAGDNYANKLAYFVTDAAYRLIDGHTFTLGYDSGSTAPVAGDIINGQTSGAHATLVSVTLASGTWAGGDAAGTFVLHVTYGTFQNNETLNNETTSVTDFATVDTVAGNAVNDDTIVLVGVAQSSTSQDVVIYDWDTSINKVVVQSGQQSVRVIDVYLDTATGLTATTGGSVAGYRLKIADASAGLWGYISLSQCYVESSSGFALTAYTHGYIFFSQSKVYTTTASDYCVRLYNVGIFYPYAGSILDAASMTGTFGISCYGNSAFITSTSVAPGYPRIRNQATGIYAWQGGQAVTNSLIQYIHNTVDENAVAASYGYID